LENTYKSDGTDDRIKRNTEMGKGRKYGDDSPAGGTVEVVMTMKTRIENLIIGNRRMRRMLTVAATLFFAGAVFQITADKWPEGVIYFVAAACFVSLERACSRKADEAVNNSEITDREEGDNE
jgi:hypothetical protein